MVKSLDKKTRALVPGAVPGYTLLEILIAIAIVCVLAAIAVPSFLGYREKAKVTVAVTDIKLIGEKIAEYLDVNGTLPARLSDVNADRLRDPWGNPYEYLVVTGSSSQSGRVRKDRNTHPINSDFDLYSKGRDGKSASALTAKISQDDVIRANNGGYIGLASDY